MAVDASGTQGFTAVIADRLPLVRVGLAASLLLVGVTTVAYVEEVTDGVAAACRDGATLLVLGGEGDATAGPLASQIGQLGATRVVVLVAQADCRTLTAMFEAGADAVALWTIVPEDFGVLVRRVLGGQRSVDPALMPVLLEMARVRAGPKEPGSSRQRPTAAVAVRDRTADPGGEPRRGVDGPLTTKELEVLRRLAQGDSNAEIAVALFVSRATVKTHLAHIYAKLAVGSRHGAMSRATALGLLA